MVRRTEPLQGWSENGDDVVGSVDVVSDMRAAQERKSPVVNARNARCQNFLSKFIGVDEPRRGVEPTIMNGSAGAEGFAGEDDRALVGET